MEQKIIITRGLPASGKSTWAKTTVANNPDKINRVNKDDLRTMLNSSKFSKNNEKYIIQLRNQIILSTLDSGKDIIVDDTNLNPIHIEDITNLVKDRINVKIEIKDFDTDFDTCVLRDSQRPNPVGYQVILDMAKKWIKKPRMQNEYRQHDINKQNCIICDLDGTLAIIGDRSPYDASNCHIVDDINIAVRDLLQSYFNASPIKLHKIFFLSGRDEKYRESTEKFLQKYFATNDEVKLLDFSELYMRPNGDSRKDSIIKKELFEKYIEPDNNVLFWLDDRNQVVDMVRKELRIPCFQVNYGDF